MVNLTALTSLDRRSKQILQVLYDATAAGLAFWLAFALDLQYHGLGLVATLGLAVAAVIITPACYLAAGVYRAVVRFMAGALGIRVLLATAVSAVLVTVFVELLSEHYAWRFAVDFGLLLLLLMASPRVVLRWIAEKQALEDKPIAVIYGAGAAGRQLLSSTRASGDLRVFAFVDDDPSLTGSTIMGLPVYSAKHVENVVERQNANLVLLAIPSAGLEKRKGIVALLEGKAIRVLTVPGLADLLSGKAAVSELRDVAIEDLLGREAVSPHPDLIGKEIFGKTVLITGAGGSIGSELCRQALLQNPIKIILFEISEYALYSVDTELRQQAEQLGIHSAIVPVLGTVQDKRRVLEVMQRHAVDTVYHAAAYKHVPLVEQNPTRAVTNNVEGTWVVAQAAMKSQVASFTLVSTDKAVRPTNVMGASKRLAELGVQALAARVKAQGEGPCFSIVRFGNVLGSSGSVVPLFRKQIALGGPITVTHPDIIRYFMTIPEAAQLVIQAGALAEGGDVFVLDMGEPVKIANLAERMVNLSGLTVKTDEQPGDIEIVYSGLRPGEKLFEELLVSGEELETQHERICRTIEPALDYEEWEALLASLTNAVKAGDLETLRETILNAPVFWKPDGEHLGDVGLAVQA